ncbi:LPS assembly lipoprotein LptE [Pseudomonas stutzeri]|nr:LPS assembly lipoprotein LptE [Stutzerimonas stutzeri]
MKPGLSALLLLTLTTLLTACGFQLRGTAGDDFAVHELDLRARDAYGDTVKEVREVLENSGVRVHGGAPYQLVLGREQQSQRTASYTSAARSAENELTASLDYQVRSGNLQLLAERVEVQKVYVHDANNLIGSQQEAARLRAEMRHELVRQLALRLRQLSPARLEQLREQAQARAETEARAADVGAQGGPASPAR